MQTASLELSKQLFEVSGWYDHANGVWPDDEADAIQKYSLGFLIRKLPAKYYNLTKVVDSPEYISYIYKNGAIQQELGDDTPENVLTKLCIALFEAGILTREGE